MKSKNPKKKSKIYKSVGTQMYSWANDLFPICRSLTGDGVRETLKFIKEIIPDLKIKEVPSGTKAYDWIVPNEWNIKNAYIENEQGKRIIDFNNNNLHVIGYSEPIDIWLERDELINNLYSLPDQPDAIPYITSYYSRKWGFCLTHKQLESLPKGKYHVVIDSELKPGVMNYGELIINGETKEEIFLSTYICHPSMANNELSGPVVSIALANWLLNLKKRRYTYRIVFIPETIGSIIYLSQHLDHLKKHVVAGFNITCIGDEREYSYLPSRQEQSLSDQVALHVFKYLGLDFKKYSFLDRGSDERQYCSPGVDLPIASIMRSKYGTYPEYHTSLDNLDFISPNGLEGGYGVLLQCLKCLESNRIYKPRVICEPQLGKRGLYPTLSTKTSMMEVKDMMNFLAYCDGSKDLLQIAEKIDIPVWNLFSIVERLIKNKIIDQVDY